jgi:hypothetical protein
MGKHNLVLKLVKEVGKVLITFLILYYELSTSSEVDNITYNTYDLYLKGKKIGKMYEKIETPQNSNYVFSFITLKLKKYEITIAGIIHDDKINKFKLPITGIVTKNKKIKNKVGYCKFIKN